MNTEKIYSLEQEKREHSFWILMLFTQDENFQIDRNMNWDIWDVCMIEKVPQTAHLDYYHTSLVASEITQKIEQKIKEIMKNKRKKNDKRDYAFFWCVDRDSDPLLNRALGEEIEVRKLKKFARRKGTLLFAVDQYKNGWRG